MKPTIVNISNNKRIVEISDNFSKCIGKLLVDYPTEIAFILECEEKIPSTKDASNLLKLKQTNNRALSMIEYVVMIIYSLNTLKKEEALTLWFGYFFKAKLDSFINRYSKSGYYRIRARSIEHFLVILDNTIE